MIEKVKSVLLVFLIGMSLFLTYQLWYGTMPAQLIVEDVYERILVEEPRPLENTLTPSQVAISAGEAFYLLRKGEPGYDDLWEALSQTLQNISIDTTVGEEMPPEDSGKLLTYHLQPAIPAGDGLPWFSDAPYTEIEKIELFSAGDQKWLVLSELGSDNKIRLLLSPGKTELFADMLEEIPLEGKILRSRLTPELIALQTEMELEVTGPIYVPEVPVYMNELILKPESMDRDMILKTFFVDYNMARIIEEKDGGLIYTDGDKGLRLKNTGLEYSSPQKEEGQATASYPEALTVSSNFISNHGGWPENLRLEEISLSRWGRTAYYNVRWMAYYDGFPIFAVQPTRALFNDNGLIHYARSIFTPENVIIEENGREPAAAWNDALEEAVALFREQEGESGRVMRLEEMSLGYAIIDASNNYRGKPIWRIKINGTTVILCAMQLEPAGEEYLL